MDEGIMLRMELDGAIDDDQQDEREGRVVEKYTARKPTGYVHDVRMMGHAPISPHPEMPQRLSHIFSILAQSDIIQNMIRLSLRPVNKEEALLVHSEDHWEKVEAIQFMTEDQIRESESFYEQLSLYVHPQTTEAAKLSCGGVIESCLAVARGEVQNSFAIVRPPGHHAEPDEHMGFCFFNNVAVAARVVLQQTSIKRILILDWDVHHGNGTQRAFYDDPQVLYVSLHRFENGRFYPTGPFGGMSQCGEGQGLGATVNVPWPEKGMGDADYLYAFQKLIMPIACEFSPELVIVSAGFDAAEGDELGECHVTPEGYAHMTHLLMSLAGGKIVIALEGGYNLDSISVSSLAVAKVLLGHPPPELPPMIASDVATETVYQCAYIQSRYWRSVDPVVCEPKEDLGLSAATIPELLKSYRAYYLAKEHQMFQIPFVDEDLDAKFAAQVHCSPDVYQAETLILFIHDFGHLRLQMRNRVDCDVQSEYSYFVDASRELINWSRAEHFAILDVNLDGQPNILYNNDATPASRVAKTALLYIWDNYVELSDASSVAFVGVGSACKAIMNLITARAVRNKTKAVCLCVDDAPIPRLDRDAPEDLKIWYKNCSSVLVAANHQTLAGGRLSIRHGSVRITPESDPIERLIKALPRLQEHIQEKIGFQSSGKLNRL